MVMVLGAPVFASQACPGKTANAKAGMGRHNLHLSMVLIIMMEILGPGCSN